MTQTNEAPHLFLTHLPHPTSSLIVRLLLLMLTRSPTILFRYLDILLLPHLPFLLLPPLPLLLLLLHLLLILSLFLPLTLVPALVVLLLIPRLSQPQLLTPLSLLLSKTILKVFLALRIPSHPSFSVPDPLITSPWTLTRLPRLRSRSLVLGPL